jgi:hypothetical protein
MLVLAYQRLCNHKTIFGAWSASFIVALIATVALLFSAIVPSPVDVERYWGAWVGERILATGAIPHAIGAESPLSTGAPWIVQQWLYALGVAEARDHHVFWIFSLAAAAGMASIIWFSLGICIREKLDPGLSFIITLFVGIIAVWRFEIRAEAFAVALLVTTATLARKKLRVGGWLVLGALFVLWANIHASFPMGLALCAYAAIRARRYTNLGAIACAGALTLLNPNLWGLWGYVFWLPHSWIKDAVLEWQPTWVGAPTLIAALLLPILLYLRPNHLRSDAILKIGLWITTTVATLTSVRFMLFAVAVGVPVGCAAVRSTFVLRLPRKLGGLTALVTCGFITAYVIFRCGFYGSYPVLDPAFGLVVPEHSSQIQIAAIDPKPGTLTLCASESDCTVLLYYGGTTVFDARTDPFPEPLFLAANRFFIDSQDPLRSRVERILTDTRMHYLPAVPGFEKTRTLGTLIIYDRVERTAGAAS